MAQRLKFVEIGVALLAVVGFLLHSAVILFLALFLFGVIAALFGPIKYGILPDHLQRSELPAGNALVEGATFIAILLGTIAGGLAATEGSDPIFFAFLIIAFSLSCWISSLFIPPTGQAAPNLVVRTNIAVSTCDLVQQLREDSRIWWGAIVTCWFWAVGGLALVLLPPLVKNTLGGSEEVATLCLAIFAIAIAVGSGLAAWLAAGRIILLPTVLGAVLLGLFSFDLGFATWGLVPAEQGRGIAEVFGSVRGVRIGIDLAGLAIAGGLFIVPVFAAVQSWAGVDRRARVIAGVNVLNAAAMALSTLLIAVLQLRSIELPFSDLQIPFIGAIHAHAVHADGRRQPRRRLRHRQDHAGERAQRRPVDHLSRAVPDRGRGPGESAQGRPERHHRAQPCELPRRRLGDVAAQPPPVFAIDVGIARRWWVKPFLKLTDALPLDPMRPLAVRTLIDAVKAGKALIIFPEGRITVTGSLMKVYDGAAMIADKADAEVIPVRIEGLEQTPFSRLSPEQVRRKWFPKVKVTVLEPVKLTVDPALKGRKRRQAAGAALYGIMSDLVFRTTSTDKTMVQAVIEAADRHGQKRVAIEDPVTGAMTYKRLLTAVSVLGAKLMPLAPEGRPIGVMLPNANGAVVTILGLMSAGRVPAMINFTAGSTNILAGCKAAEVTTIVTSRTFIEKGRLDNLAAQLSAKLSLVYLEDLRPSITFLDKIRGLLHRNKPLVDRNADDWAAILFTSGSEGVPKGVVLSHRNMLANAAQAAARIDFGRQDKVFSVLPVFHSFGLTVGTMLPLVSGVPIYLYPSPLHYRTVSELIYGVNATIMFGTDTFLNGYARVAHPYDFRSLRYILAGAEPVKESTRRVYMEKFGLRILEGYGVTETAPALALNTPMFNKFGTVGRILPGMEARLEKVEGVEEGGRLFVRGPNVMLGYLKVDKPGVLEPPAEGWHDTGDIVTIDEQGFVQIRGRAKRFAKVGGEMISLAAVEMLAGDLWQNAPSAVVAAPDPRKGERLILVTQQKDATRSQFIAFAREHHASELMIPAEIMILEKMPLLGSGKVDMMSLNKLVQEHMARRWRLRRRIRKPTLAEVRSSLREAQISIRRRTKAITHRVIPRDTKHALHGSSLA